MNRVDLDSEFSLIESIDAHHNFAYKFNFGVFVRSVDGSTLECVFRDNERSVNAPLAWSPDGSTLYHAYDQVYAINITTRSAKALTDFPDRFSVNVHLHSSCEAGVLPSRYAAAGPWTKRDGGPGWPKRLG
ncbi:MAG: hypothetical protein KY475_08575 [Planctomycetes bacterium]|nr:hypothetical protein [Planctomycetota bacterium]